LSVRPIVLPMSGHAAWDDLAAWWLSRFKVSTQRTCATCLPRWTTWCADRAIDPQAARRDIQRLLRHTRPETTLASYDTSGDARERRASHHVAGFLAGWASQPTEAPHFLARSPSGRLQ
jgi:hypothetical protein